MSAYNDKYREKLRQRVEYELFILDFIRHRLHYHSESPTDYCSVNLTEINTNPDTFFIEGHHHIVADPCAWAVRDTVSQFIPLAFVSAFKINDMIAEWILDTLDIQVPSSFQRKYKFFKSVRKCILSPPFFNQHVEVENSFWRLYSSVSKLRGKILHGWDFKLEEDGSIKFLSTVSKQPSTLTKSEITAYLGFTNLLVKFILDDLAPEKRLFAARNLFRHLITLKKYHHVKINSLKPTRLLQIDIKTHDASDGPIPDNYTVNIPMDRLLNRIESDYRDKGRYEVLSLLHLVAEDDKKRVTWVILPEDVSRDSLQLTMGDSKSQITLLKN